jgi:hypothetical protein
MKHIAQFFGRFRSASIDVHESYAFFFFAPVMRFRHTSLPAVVSALCDSYVV